MILLFGIDLAHQIHTFTCFSLGRLYLLIATRGTWATSLTWEAVATIQTILCRKNLKDTIDLCLFLLISDYLKMKKDITLDLNKPESPLTENVLCHIWLKLAQWYWEEYLISAIYFHYFAIISSWKGAWTFISNF